ncbi:hypothetical protein [Corynebacterium sp. HMSC08C04]|uniref:GNAT family N-acetyltransferase, cg3035/Rv0428c family n=1 Tax=Corynebacterium sp. HMSC08C04 TaxID=1581137 RepID=UPI000AAD389E
MSYIFRSDAVSVGDRVVARREFGGTHSDVIGHVLSTSPLVIRPQAVGGYPSDLEAVEIPAEQLKIIKKLSPRTVRNSEIRAVEVAAAAARGGTKVWTNDGQWLMRFGEGTDSAIPLGPSAGFMPAPMEEIDAFYAAHNLPTRLAIPERIGKAALRVLDNEPAAWQLEPEVLVFTRSLETLRAPSRTLTPRFSTPRSANPATSACGWESRCLETPPPHSWRRFWPGAKQTVRRMHSWRWRRRKAQRWPCLVKSGF